MSTKPLRVVVWSTGGIGSIAIRAIHERPDLELVGVRVYSPDKVGRDAGVLAGGEPIGVLATNDVDALLALRPDCIFYAANPVNLDVEATQDYVRFLKAGINVCCTTSTRLVHPPAFTPDLLNALTEAARVGGASLYASGIEPGFAADQLPLALTTMSKSIRSIHSTEFGLYDDYPVADVLMHGMGFGMPLDYKPQLGIPGAVAYQWGGVVRMIADALGVKLQDIRQIFERRATERTLNVACGKIEAGTCGAIRLQAIGVVDGRNAIIVEHVNRMASDVAPEWPRGVTELSYHIEIKGEPDITCDLALDLAHPEKAGIKNMVAGAGAMVATAMRAVNAIPYVVEATPGLVSSLDLPLTVPRGALSFGS